MTTETKPNLDLSFLKQFIEANPTVLDGMFKRGRPKGKKNNLTVEPGKDIIIPNSTYEATVEAQPSNVVEMTPKEAKQLVQKIKRPHVFKTEETKLKMLNILAEGRAKAKITKDEKKKQREEEMMRNMKIIKVKETKPKQVKQQRTIQRTARGRPKKELVNVISDDEESELDETDEEILKAKKKIERKKALLKEIDEEIVAVSQPSGQRQSSFSSQFRW